MGSARPYRPPTPPSQLQPKSPRAAKARDIVDPILEHLVKWVFEPYGGRNQERECYEVAAQLRGQRDRLEGIVRENLPGSATTPEGVARNRMTLDAKVAMVVIDKLVNEVVRPGPTPEDRQGNELRSEAWALRHALVDLVAAVITVDDKARGLA